MLRFTRAQGHDPDTFQQGGLRKILGIAQTYIDRNYANDEVIRLANLTKGCPEDDDISTTTPLSEVVSKKEQLPYSNCTTTRQEILYALTLKRRVNDQTKNAGMQKSRNIKP